MRTHILIAMGHVVLLVVGGCQPSGWLLKPVPIDEELQETVVDRDEGWFVHEKVVIVDVDGTLVNQRSQGMLGAGENPVSLFVEKLDRVADDPSVRAVVLRINSPGGSVTASDIMHRQLLTFREKHKIPVVAMIEDVGASGAYYLACGADKILAHPTAIVGSIGVIMHTVSFAETMKKIGVEAKALTSGPYKDLASPLKPLDEKDLSLLQKMIDSYFKRFLGVVEAGRPKLIAKKIKRLADGRVFTGEQAERLGLVDGLGYVESAIQTAKKLAGVQKVRVVIYHRPLGYRANVYSRGMASVPQFNLINLSVPDLLDLTRPQFLYLWTGRTVTP